VEPITDHPVDPLFRPERRLSISATETTLQAVRGRDRLLREVPQHFCPSQNRGMADRTVPRV